MKNVLIGEKLVIHAYKHNGKLYRSWDEAIIIDEKEDVLVVGNNKTTVMEIDGRTHKTKEPSIIYFYKDKWFNVIGQLKERGLTYKCNIASPYIIEGNVIKYIDYDLDLRIFADGGFKILDRAEYKYHRTAMQYSKDLDIVIENALNELIELYKKKTGPFAPGMIDFYHEEYETLVKKTENV